MHFFTTYTHNAITGGNNHFANLSDAKEFCQNIFEEIGGGILEWVDMSDIFTAFDIETDSSFYITKSF